MASPNLPPVLAVTQLSSAADSVNTPPTGGPVPPATPPVQFPIHHIRGGSWLLSYKPRNTTARYDGTLRVENHQAGEAVTGRTASGDLYLRPTTIIANPGGEGQLPINLPSPNPANGIPIFARDKYKYYIRVIKIDEGISLGRRTFVLELEFYRFTQRTPVDFQFVLEDTHTVTLTWKTAPAGYPSAQDYAEGDARSNKTGEIAGRLTFGWLSAYYRKVSLEIDTVHGATVPLEDSSKSENWRTIFDRVGFQFHQITSQRDIPDTDEDAWDAAELHAALTTNRQAGTDLDKEWRFHLLVVKRFSREGLFGVMFDTNNAGPRATDPNLAPREGIAVGTELQLDDRPGWGANRGKKFGDAASPFLRTAAHELGHAFGLYHTFADHSFLAETMSILRDSTAAAPFDTQITWNYGPADLKRLRHFPDPFVRPGGIDFGRQTDTHPPLTPDDRQVDVPGLRLSVSLLRADVPLGAPVRADLTITNRGDAAIPVPENFGLSSSFTAGIVTDASGTARAFRPLVCYDGIEPLAQLAKGETRTAALTLLGGPDGPLFQSTGLNTITAHVSWNLDSDGAGHRAAISLSATATVLVTPPVQASHTAAAYRILTTPDAHTALVLGGHHLEDGIQAIREAVSDEVLGPHYAAVEARRLATKCRAREADIEGAEKVLAGAEVVASASELAKLDKLGVKVGDPGGSLTTRPKPQLLGDGGTD